ncbi:alpha/beta fold hydrolase [Marinobacter zhanjiangensis]|uniref:Alpha/beta hydrolase n=1 Tax=Marinobacter zhanjiangensis TaxID=578215 RepID=A0ABQ3B9N8_9GAMM|nr:alpha/beta hydrolase [Marinobacter zhanjiangensis]GGY85331.1 alpha/beta hydrolase [Marinobacter zhanjiangensis]
MNALFRLRGEDRFCELSHGLRLCYREYGHPNDEPMLLVAGLGLQLTSWPATMVEHLTAEGYRVVVFDNRDVGRSSMHEGQPPGVMRQLFRVPAPDGYDIADMARDALGLLDHLNIEKSHVVGMSMGGMIAQTMAALEPRRLLSLTSIFSTTGNRRVGQPAMSSVIKLVGPPARTREDHVSRHLAMMRHIGPTAYPLCEETHGAYAAEGWDRGHGEHAHKGVARQIGAIARTGDRTPQLKTIRTPTLVVHGDRDLMVAPSGGQATARAIKNARLVTIPGMGHSFPEPVIPELAGAIVAHARQAGGVS